MSLIKFGNNIVNTDMISSVEFDVYTKHIYDVIVDITIKQTNNSVYSISVQLLGSKEVKDKFDTTEMSFGIKPGLETSADYNDLNEDYDISVIVDRVHGILSGDITLKKDQCIMSYLLDAVNNDEEIIQALTAMSELRNSRLVLLSQEDVDKKIVKRELYGEITNCASPEELDILNKRLKDADEETIPDMETLAETQRHLIGPRQELTAPAENWLRKNKNSSDGKDEKEEILSLNSKSSCGIPTGLQIFIIMVLIFLAIYMVVK